MEIFKFKRAASRRRITQAVLSAFVLLAILASPFPLRAARNLDAEKSNLENRLRRVRQALARKKLEEKGVAAQFRKIDEELTVTRRELERKIRDLNRARAQEAFYQKKLEIASNKFSAYKGKHKYRLVEFYKNSRAGYIEVLFNSASFSDFVSRLAYLRIITKNDLNILTELKAIREEVAERRRQVEAARENIELDRNLLAQKKEHISEVHEMKRSALIDVQKDRRLLEEQERELEIENQKIEAELQRMRGMGVQGKFTGTLGSPVCGRPLSISSSFGYRRAPRRGASTNHHGVDIRASYGDDICAAADGIVLQSRYRNGYGLTVIISHGSDIATLYAHGLRTLVSEGQTVRKGQVIMKADNTGISTGNHLHFEVRVNGVAVNPMRNY